MKTHFLPDGAGSSSIVPEDLLRMVLRVPFKVLEVLSVTKTRHLREAMSAAGGTFFFLSPQVQG